MKINIKSIGACAALALACFGTTSCNDALDLKPVNQITPDDFYKSADQLAAYLNNYYAGYLSNPYTDMFHVEGRYNDGMAHLCARKRKHQTLQRQALGSAFGQGAARLLWRRAHLQFPARQD